MTQYNAFANQVVGVIVNSFENNPHFNLWWKRLPEPLRDEWRGQTAMTIEHLAKTFGEEERVLVEDQAESPTHPEDHEEDLEEVEEEEEEEDEEGTDDVLDQFGEPTTQKEGAQT